MNLLRVQDADSKTLKRSLIISNQIPAEKIPRGFFVERKGEKRRHVSEHNGDDSEGEGNHVPDKGGADVCPV